MKTIALCTGEPAGIGPDLAILQCVEHYRANNKQNQRIVCLGDPELLRQRARSLKQDINIEIFDAHKTPAQSNRANYLLVKPIAGLKLESAHQLNPLNSQYVLNILNDAIQGCQSSQYDAMVTAPVQKSVINEAGIPFTGHTEYLAEKTGTDKVVMMLATRQMKVTLATTHLPLKDVATAITQDSLSQTIRIIQKDLRQYFGLAQPRLLVCGLNPHAGEDGHLGMEEIETITPCLNQLREQGFELIGPLPADTLFTEKVLTQGDAVLAMYHDQGLPVLKFHGFGKAANITLGLPIIRTSVDHGTAIDLVGTGNINLGSLTTATEIAFEMANKRVS